MSQPKPKAVPTRRRDTQVIVAIIGAIAVIVAAVIATMKGCSPLPPKPLVLQINQPTFGKVVDVTFKPDDAGAYFPVNGTLSGRPSKPNLEICAVVYDKAEWWLQDCVPAKEGTWNLDAWVGGRDNQPKSGQKNSIEAVLADIDTVESYKSKNVAISKDAKEINAVLLSVNSPEFTLSLVQK